MPLTQRHALFVTDKAGLLRPLCRATDVRVQSRREAFVIYAEPVGYVWAANGDAYDFGVSVDFAVKSPDGKILSGQDGFGKFAMTSGSKLQEFMLNLTLSVDGAPPGNYLLQYKIHDLHSDKVSIFELPFSIVQ